jgi:ketosteroid isomerase-like protein
MGKWPTDSPAPADVLRRVVEVGNRNNWDGNAVAGFFRADHEAHTFPEWPGPARYTGRDGFGRLLDEWTQNFHDFHWELEEVFDAGEKKVVGVGRLAGRSMHLGVPIEGELAGVFEIDQGVICESWFFTSRDEALTAARLKA